MSRKDFLLLLNAIEQIEYRNWEKAKYFANRLCDINYQTEDGNTVLLRACWASCPSDFLKWLIEKGADVNHSHNGSTALDGVLVTNNKENLEILLENGARWCKTEYIGSALTSSAQELSAQLFDYNQQSRYSELYQSNKQNADRLNSRDENRLTALMHAAKEKNVATVKRLIEAGADVNLKDKDGKTALEYSLYPCSLYWDETALEIPKMLIEAGADVLSQNYEGQTALMALKKRYDHALDERNFAPLNKSYYDLYQERMRFLEPIEAERTVIDPSRLNEVNEHKQTLLMLAVSENNLYKVKRLIEAGADLNLQDKKGRTALMYALAPTDYCWVEEPIEIVKALIEGGADLSVRNNKDQTAFEELKAISKQVIPYRHFSAKHNQWASLYEERLNFVKDIEEKGLLIAHNQDKATNILKASQRQR